MTALPRNGGGVYLPEAYRAGSELRCKHCDTTVDLANVAHLVVEVQGEPMCVELRAVSPSDEHARQLDAVCDALAVVQTRPSSPIRIRGVM